MNPPNSAAPRATTGRRMGERRGKLDIPVTVAGKRIDQPLADLLNYVETRKQREEARIFEYLTTIERPNLTINMNDDHSTNIQGNVTNSQVGQTLTNCTNMIQQMPTGELREILETLTNELDAIRDEMKGKDAKVRRAAGDAGGGSSETGGAT